MRDLDELINEYQVLREYGQSQSKLCHLIDALVEELESLRAKLSGQYYTPDHIVRIADPACGTGSVLAEAAREAKL